MKTERPVLNGKTNKENIHILETWAQNLMDELEYVLSHLDQTNMAEPDRLITIQQMQEAMEKQQKEMRELIANRTKGA